MQKVQHHHDTRNHSTNYLEGPNQARVDEQMARIEAEEQGEQALILDAWEDALVTWMTGLQRRLDAEVAVDAPDERPVEEGWSAWSHGESYLGSQEEREQEERQTWRDEATLRSVELEEEPPAVDADREGVIARELTRLWAREYALTRELEQIWARRGD